MRKIYQNNLVVQRRRVSMYLVKNLGRTLLLTVMFALFAATGFSQSDKFWSNHAGKNVAKTTKAISRQSFPKEFKLFDLNTNSLHQQLFSAVSGRRSVVISLPNAEGQLEQFEVAEASNFDAALQAKFPEIRAFSGKGITDRYATLKLSISPQGVHTMVFRTEKENEFMEPYSDDHSVYAVYHSSRNKGSLPWTCSTQEHEMFSGLKTDIENSGNVVNSSAGELKVLRLAQSCNAEYANYFNAFSAADVALVLAAFNTTLTRCNGVYEKDLAVHLNLVNNTSIIFYDPATDPYTAWDQGNGIDDWNGQLQTTLNNNVGAANYDIGHMFGQDGGGGNAGCIGCVCDQFKGSGITSPADGIPEGDNFDIDYVVHEVGHQLGALHTFSFSAAQIGAASVEVGSGITIMGYAGIVAGANVAAHSLDYYHAFSISQIQANLATKTCPVTTNISANNATPVVGPLTPYTIPISTPFALTGTATDANAGDVLTYAWEQYDAATNASNGGLAAATKLTGPNYASFPVRPNGVRLFPRLESILTGASTTSGTINGGNNVNIEALSSVARTLNFRLTVRDNSPYVASGAMKVGQTAFGNVAITVSAAVGPFLITSQNAATTYASGSTQTITWSVNNTTGAPTNTANVKISWSSDGGLTFPTVLAASTANDGTETFTVPAGATTAGRIKVEAIGNIYFDINNANITVTAPLNDFVFGTPVVTPATCPATSIAATIPTTVTGTFVTPINLTATAGVPAGANVTFAPNPLTPGSSVVATLNNTGALGAGTYAVTVTGTAGSTVHTVVVNFVISAGTAPTLTGPAAQVVCAGTAANFTVTSTGTPTGYQWQVSTIAAPTFVDIAGATSATYTIASTTAAQNGNQYRVIVTTQCATATSAAATLTVQASPAITAQPQSTTVCAGTNANFAVTATGAGLGYQWQQSIDNGVSFQNISGATAATYTITGVTAGQSGYQYRVNVQGTCLPAVTSAAAILTVGDAAAITTGPASVTVCEGANPSFSVVASGTNLTYQWQVSTAAVPTFTNIPGATATTYTITGATAAQNGNQYRVIVFSCTPTGITSSAATLTVNTPVAIGTQPVASTVCAGTTATFSVAATGTALTYQWQYSATCAGTFTNLTGQTAATLSLANVTTANAGAYRVIVTGACGPVTSSCVLLTVNVPVTISTQPTDFSICLPVTGTVNGTFTVAAAGTGLTYQWQQSTDGGTNFANITGATAATLTLTNLTATMNGYKYRVVLSGTCTPTLNSAVATLTVNVPVNISAQPQNKRICSGENTTFAVTATGSTITYQWQVSVNGGPYVNIANAGIYTGATTNTLTLTNVTTLYNGYKYRVVVSGVPCGAVNSSEATLTVNQTPTVELALQSYANITPAIRTGLFPVVSPAAGPYTYAWYKNGSLLNGVGTSPLPISVDDFGTYTVMATNSVTGCFDVSDAVTLSALASDALFVYPNPSSGKFEVRYYNAGGAAHTRTLSIYDSKGAQVFKQQYALTGVYAKMAVNMVGAGAGVYFVDLTDAAGKRIATGKVVIRR